MSFENAIDFFSKINWYCKNVIAYGIITAGKFERKKKQQNGPIKFAYGDRFYVASAIIPS